MFISKYSLKFVHFLLLKDLSERCVFHFAGTMPSEEARHDQFVFERVSWEMKHRLKVKPNPLAKLSISDKRDDLKEVSKVGTHTCTHTHTHTHTLL